VSVPEVEILFEADAKPYLPSNVARATVLKVSGSLFFGSINYFEKILARLSHQNGRAEALIIVFERVQNLDESAINVFSHEALKRKKSGGDLFLWLGDHKLDKKIYSSQLLEVIDDNHLLYR